MQIYLYFLTKPFMYIECMIRLRNLERDLSQTDLSHA